MSLLWLCVENQKTKLCKKQKSQNTIIIDINDTLSRSRSVCLQQKPSRSIILNNAISFSIFERSVSSVEYFGSVIQASNSEILISFLSRQSPWYESTNAYATLFPFFFSLQLHVLAENGIGVSDSHIFILAISLLVLNFP